MADAKRPWVLSSRIDGVLGTAARVNCLARACADAQLEPPIRVFPGFSGWTSSLMSSVKLFDPFRLCRWSGTPEMASNAVTEIMLQRAVLMTDEKPVSTFPGTLERPYNPGLAQGLQDRQQNTWCHADTFQKNRSFGIVPVQPREATYQGSAGIDAPGNVMNGDSDMLVVTGFQRPEQRMFAPIIGRDAVVDVQAGQARDIEDLGRQYRPS